MTRSRFPEGKDGDDSLLPELLDDAFVDKLMGEDATHQPWDKLAGEGNRPYAAFCKYRDMGPERTIDALQKAIGGSAASYRTLSSVHGWVRRCEAYDDYLERQERKLIERGRLDARRRQINLGQALQNKAMEGLMALNPLLATPRDLALMADIGAKLERAGRGEIDTKRLEITGQGGGPVAVAQQLDSADRREFLASIQAQINQRLGQIEGPVIIPGEVVHGDEEAG